MKKKYLSVLGGFFVIFLLFFPTSVWSDDKFEELSYSDEIVETIMNEAKKYQEDTNNVSIEINGETYYFDIIKGNKNLKFDGKVYREKLVNFSPKKIADVPSKTKATLWYNPSGYFEFSHETAISWITIAFTNSYTRYYYVEDSVLMRRSETDPTIVGKFEDRVYTYVTD